MKSIIIILTILSILISGCANRQIEYRDVHHVVYKVPESPKLERPELPINNLSMEDREDWKMVLPSYVISVRLLLNYSLALEEIINTYNDLARFNVISDNLENNMPRLLGASENNVPAPYSNINYLQARQRIDTEQKFKEIIRNYNANRNKIILENENDLESN